MVGLVIAAALAATALLVVSVVSLSWQLYSWRTPDDTASQIFARARSIAPRHRITVIVPARHEEKVLEATVMGLSQLRHPDFEVLVVVGHDDDGTREIAESVAARVPSIVRVVIDHSWPKNKPKALNSALAEARGDVLVVFDAEDEVAPDLLLALDGMLTLSGADVVQGGVQLMNHHSNWYSVHNVLEYWFWFRSRLHLQADHGFFPLGGNTFAVRAEMVRAIGGWDPECLAEDCDLGVRLSCRGARFVAVYDPVLTTREETPASLAQFIKQRTRWNQGFIQVFRKGAWHRLGTRRERLFALATLGTPYAQALMVVILPFSISVFFVKLPILLALLMWTPVVPVVSTVAINLAALHDFCRTYQRPFRARDIIRLVLGTPFFQLLLAFAATRAVWRELRGKRGWELTSHSNLHRLPEPESPTRSVVKTAS